MRKALIAVAVATALFAVGAFAASFAVQSEDIASGANPVTACAAKVDVDFTTVYDNAGDWNVTAAEVTFFNADNTPVATCAGYGANLAVMTTGGPPAVTGTATVATGATSVVVPLPPGTVKASAVTSAAVLVDGQTLTVASPGEGFPPAAP